MNCPLAGWGTAARGSGRGQACRSMRLLFLLQAGEILPVVVVAPPGSLKYVRKTMLRRTSKGKHFSSAIMELTLKKDKNQDGTVFSRISMHPIEDLNDEVAKQMRAYGESLAPAVEAQARAAMEDQGLGDETEEALARAGEEMEKGTSKGTDDIPF